MWPQFKSEKFKNYCLINGIKINNVMLYAPFQNGEVERMTRGILKRARISQTLNQDWQDELNKYLLMYTGKEYRRHVTHLKKYHESTTNSLNPLSIQPSTKSTSNASTSNESTSNELTSTGTTPNESTRNSSDQLHDNTQQNSY